MARTRVRLFSRGFDDVFDQWARNDGAARIERIAAAARADAPVESGDYQGSIRTELVYTDRPVWRCIADVPHALVVNANTGNLPRAMDAGR